jgi:transcriptional regulator with XRE-family HTH domain
MTSSAFKDRLRQARELRGWTQDVLAKKSGISATQISHFETGVKPSGSAATLVKLANALEVSVDFLLGRIDEPEAVSDRVSVIMRRLGSASGNTLDAVDEIVKALVQKDRNAHGS